ncbi:anti-phage deoxyguanosine triphosphatase [Staphylospora marina]|uniref:anti-phage deoxyguanosine triphosphatase n=1 Tax=Staphylospora marina TaxID=2490858 RepID=UPI001F151074|nr:anti-phage deoxyguanosine triphosphatase [Staphylospora marina]
MKHILAGGGIKHDHRPGWLEECTMILVRHDDSPMYSESDKERRKPGTAPDGTEARDAFEKDYGRIVHSAAFRRLQSKTQVIGTGVGDFYRTRLTHSMEVAQIARGIAIHLNHSHPLFADENRLDVSLLEAAALAHDLGHPPFGHRGEQALHECMAGYGGFEGNAHTFRILTRLEGDRVYGLNLTRALLLSVMKYPVLLDDAMEGRKPDPRGRLTPPKASVFGEDREAFEWVLAPFSDEERAFLTRTAADPDGGRETLHKSLECSIIELADDIAYGTHDMEDAINLRLIHPSRLTEMVEPLKNRSEWPELGMAFRELQGIDPESDDLKYRLKHAISGIISTFIRHVEPVPLMENARSPRIRFNVTLPLELRELLDRLKWLVAEKVIFSQRVQMMSWKGATMIRQLFDAFMNEERLLTENDREAFRRAPNDRIRARVVCDYIAGMTDLFALRMHARLFGQSRGTFDI